MLPVCNVWTSVRQDCSGEKHDSANDDGLIPAEWKSAAIQAIYWTERKRLYEHWGQLLYK